MTQRRDKYAASKTSSPIRERCAVGCGTAECQLGLHGIWREPNEYDSLAGARNQCLQKEMHEEVGAMTSKGNQTELVRFPLWLPLGGVKKACRDRQASSVTAHFLT
jgi:hypothetical protein